MAFEIDYLTLRAPKFQKAMAKVCNYTDYPDMKTTYNIARIGTLLQQEIKTADKLFIDKAKQCVEPGPVPGTLMTVDGKYKFSSPEKEAEFEKTFEDFHAHTITIERHKIKLSVLEAVKLSPNELLALEPIIDDDMDIDGKKVTPIKNTAKKTQKKRRSQTQDLTSNARGLSADSETKGGTWPKSR